MKDKGQIVKEIGRVEHELAKAEPTLRDWERGEEAASRNSFLAIGAFVFGGAGVIYIFMMTRWWYYDNSLLYGIVCAVLCAVGLIGMPVELIRRSRFHRAVDELRAIVAKHRADLAELRARLVVSHE